MAMSLPAWNFRRVIFALSRTMFMALAISSAVQATGEIPTVTFRKIFKSSYPEFVEIKVSQSGSGTYDIRQLDEEANPSSFEIGADIGSICSWGIIFLDHR